MLVQCINSKGGGGVNVTVIGYWNIITMVAKWLKVICAFTLCLPVNLFTCEPLNLLFPAENIVKLLLDNGASSDITNKRNETPIDCPYNIQVYQTLLPAPPSKRYYLKMFFVFLDQKITGDG